MRKYEIEIKGITDYLMNRFDEATIDTTSKKRTGSLKTKDKEQLEKKFYTTTDGEIYVPSTQIVGCLINAGKQFRVVGKGKATYSKIFGANIQIEPECLIMQNQKYSVFRISGVNPNTRGRMMISRPRFSDWGLKFQLICYDDQIPSEVINQALEEGGRSVGIGDWRPDKKGRFGKFQVTKFKEIKE